MLNTGIAQNQWYYRPLIGFLIAAAIFITIFLYGHLVTVNIMEARNFITAREMVQNGSWLLPTMNGEPRIAKPPLPTWITAFFMIKAGTDADLLANRIPSGISALLLAFWAGLLVKRITGDEKTAVLFVLVLTTSYLFMSSARKNCWDIYSISFMTGTLWAITEALYRKKGRGVFLGLASVLMAGAFYSKGPVPFWVMLVPFLASYVIVFGGQALRENRNGLIWAFLICVALSALWPLFVYFNLPHKAATVASGESQGWFTKHTEPAWYYLLHFPEIVGIWIFHLLYGLTVPFIKKDRTPEEKFFVIWFLLTILVISVVPEKKVRYLLPAVVPGAMVAVIAVRRLKGDTGPAGKLVTGAFSLVTGCLFLVAAGGIIYFSRGKIWPLMGAPLLIGASALLIYSYIKKQIDRIPWIAVTGLCLCLVFLPPVVSNQFEHDQTDPFMHLRNVSSYKGKDFYSMGRIPPEVIWASGRTIRPLKDQPLADRMDKGEPFILMTEGALDEQPTRIHLLETIKTDKRTFFIYRYNPNVL